MECSLTSETDSAGHAIPYFGVTFKIRAVMYKQKKFKKKNPGSGKITPIFPSGS